MIVKVGIQNTDKFKELLNLFTDILTDKRIPAEAREEFYGRLKEEFCTKLK